MLALFNNDVSDRPCLSLSGQGSSANSMISGLVLKTLTKHLRLYSLLIFSASLLLMPLRFGEPAWAGPQEDALTKIEQRLFFRKYAEDDVPTRLKRIETQVFGESYSDSVDERISRITNALPAQAAPPEPQAPPPQNSQSMPPANPPRNDAVAPSSPPAEDPEDAKERLRLAALSARDAEVAKMLQEGVNLWHDKNGPAAIAKFRQVIRLDPQNAQGYYSLGVALEAKSDFAEAEKCYKKASELEPENRDFAQAIKAIQKRAVSQKQVDSKDAEINQLTQDALKEYQSGQYVSAIDLYKQLDEKKPKDPLTKYNLATIYLAINQPVTALNYYKQAAKLDPRNPKYKEAAEKLEANLNQDETERQQAEQAWQKKNAANQTGGNMGAQPNNAPPSNTEKAEKKHAEKQKSDKTPSFESDPLVFYGLHAKGAKEGIKVVEVVPSSRAAQVGLKPDDVIVAVDGAVVNNMSKMKETILHKPQGQRFQFTVERNQRVGQIQF
jgi:tetratricopeptide (TPR) repeat protein